MMDCAATSALVQVLRSFVARKILVWLGATCGWNDAVCASPLPPIIYLSCYALVI